MKYEFGSGQSRRCIFCEDGISCISPRKRIFFPYGSVSTVRMVLLGVRVIGGNKRFWMFMPRRADRYALHQLLPTIREKIAKAAPAEPIDTVHW